MLAACTSTTRVGSVSSPPRTPDPTRWKLTLEAVRDRLPPVIEAGGRAIEQVAQRTPWPSIPPTQPAVDRSARR